LFKWIRLIRDLKKKKIVWEPFLDDPNSEQYIITVDGTDLRRWEPQTHERYNRDPKQMSHKHKRAAGKFEIALSVFRPKVVWMSGPYRGGKGDREIFREGLMKKIKKGKLVIADGGYKDREDLELSEMMASPSEYDPPELHNFKSRARLRQETFNGRIHNFNCVSDIWRHGTKKMELCIEAIVVTLQYQMDHGAPLFDV